MPRILRAGTYRSNVTADSVSDSVTTTVKRRLIPRLQRRFGKDCVREWCAFNAPSRPYSPRLDAAVGPFAYERARLTTEYLRLVEQHRSFLERLWESHVRNLARYGSEEAFGFDMAINSNPNARCFLAIEIENRVSRKHLMGGALNAAALGHVGIVVGWTEDKVKALVQLRRYLHFLSEVQKPSMPVDNLVILGRAQLLSLV